MYVLPPYETRARAGPQLTVTNGPSGTAAAPCEGPFEGGSWRCAARRRPRAAGTHRDLDADAVTVAHRPDERRYELLLGREHAGELVYRDRGANVVAFLHTEVDGSLRRRGLGSTLVAGALDDARARGLRVVPLCPFVDAYVRRHPEYDELVVDDPARRW